MTLNLDPQPLAGSPLRHQFELCPEGLGRYTIDVSLPAAYLAGDANYPMIIALDGNLLFDFVHAQVNGGSAAMMPFGQAIVVGVGYPADEGGASFYARRNHDFHGPWEMSDKLGRFLHTIFDGMKAAEGKPELTMVGGGYERFMGFLRDELIPALSAHYRVDPAGRHALIGDSSGGHCVLRAVFDPRSPFKRYICISPGFGSAEGSIQQAEADYAAAHDDLDIDLFICCGDQEVDMEMTALCRIASGVIWTAEQFALRKYPSARVHWEIMNNEDHSSIPARAIAAGLKSINRMRPGVHDDEIARMMAEMTPPVDPE